ncbi:MAG: N-carbamoyl-D-amino-acid hydrolase [Rhodobacteraceae bacterium]|nr:N-carbamoyl-D-amino-acid hydrolase [Paracoccaceae bacterium]
MSRSITLAAAQLGPISKSESRTSAVNRMIALMEEGAAKGAELMVFPELALTTFFPRWYMEDQSEVDGYFETEMPSVETVPLFDAAKRLGIGFYLGYAEKAQNSAGETQRFNTSILVGPDGETLSKYRKVHLPGHWENEPWRAFQHLEKRYFESGDLGFPVVEALGGRIGMCICNDRRWPETFRMLGLQKAELVLCGYNTPAHYPPAPEHDHLQDFHNHLVLQAGAYQNGTWVVGVAKAGCEEGCDLIGGTCIIAPTGEIVAQCATLGDELAIATCDLDRCREIQDNIFNFAAHRQPGKYGLLCQ